MEILFVIGQYIGYFLIMLIILAIAVATAKSKVSWVFLAIGAGVQLPALLGTQRAYDMWGQGGDPTGYWVVYFLLLVGTVIWIVKRKNAAYVAPPREKTLSDSQESPFEIAPDKVAPAGSWRCTCGRANANYVSTCHCGQNKRDLPKDDQK